MTQDDKSIESKAPQRAWVVFTGQTDFFLLRMLKKGYRHCFVILHDGERWLSLDPLSSHTEVFVHGVPAQFDMAAWLRGRGHKVVPANIRETHKPAPFMLFTCVEAVKRVLGVHKRTVITPWQLYRYLSRDPATVPLRPHLLLRLVRSLKQKFKEVLSWEV